MVVRLMLMKQTAANRENVALNAGKALMRWISRAQTVVVQLTKTNHQMSWKRRWENPLKLKSKEKIGYIVVLLTGISL